jgi:hypothetical protein
MPSYSWNKTDPEAKHRYFELIRTGLSGSAAARRLGVSLGCDRCGPGHSHDRDPRDCADRPAQDGRSPASARRRCPRRADLPARMSGPPANRRRPAARTRDLTIARNRRQKRQGIPAAGTGDLRRQAGLTRRARGGL